MTAATPAVRVDARGLRCPWPVLRLARAMRSATTVLVIADDPAAPAEIAALAETHGWELAEEDEGWRATRPDVSQP